MSYELMIKTKLHFGLDVIESLPNVVKEYGNKCLLVTTEHLPPLDALYNRIIKILNDADITVSHYDKVVPNPSVAIVEEGVKKLNAEKADFVLAVGGGSSIDTAKSIALLNEKESFNWDEIFQLYSSPYEDYEPACKRYVPLVSIPTTAGTGSEVTQAAVLSMGHDKVSMYHQQNYSDHAFLDPKLLTTLPKRLTAATGFDSFSHAFESFINDRATVMSQYLSIEAMKLVVNNLPKSVVDLSQVEYREHLMMAQTMAGVALSTAGAEAPHPLSEIIGGFTGISHGEALALVFPEFVEASLKINPQKFGPLFQSINNQVFEPIWGQDNSLSDNIIKLLKGINLYLTFDDYKVDEETYKQIVGSPILGFLPFGSEEHLRGIIVKSKEKR